LKDSKEFPWKRRRPGNRLDNSRTSIKRCDLKTV